jgi:competence protein ComGC
MKRIIITLLAVTALITLINFSITNNSAAIGKAGCEAYIYISNNSLFEIDLSIDGVGIGNLLVGKSKTFKVELLNDTPKKIKVKVSYLDPDYIDPKSFYLLTKTKIECGQSDSMYVAFTK